MSKRPPSADMREAQRDDLIQQMDGLLSLLEAINGEDVDEEVEPLALNIFRTTEFLHRSVKK